MEPNIADPAPKWKLLHNDLLLMIHEHYRALSRTHNGHTVILQTSNHNWYVAGYLL